MSSGACDEGAGGSSVRVGPESRSRSDDRVIWRLNLMVEEREFTMPPLCSYEVTS